MAIVDIIERLRRAQAHLEPIVGDQKNKVLSLEINKLLSQMVELRAHLEHSGGVPEMTNDKQNPED